MTTNPLSPIIPAAADFTFSDKESKIGLSGQIVCSSISWLDSQAGAGTIKSTKESLFLLALANIGMFPLINWSVANYKTLLRSNLIAWVLNGAFMPFSRMIRKKISPNAQHTFSIAKAMEWGCGNGILI